MHHRTIDRQPARIDGRPIAYPLSTSERSGHKTKSPARSGAFVWRPAYGLTSSFGAGLTGSGLPILRADLRVCSSLGSRAYGLGLTLSPSRLTGLLISWEPGLRARAYPFSEQTYGSALSLWCRGLPRALTRGTGPVISSNARLTDLVSDRTAGLTGTASFSVPDLRVWTWTFRCRAYRRGLAHITPDLRAWSFTCGAGLTGSALHLDNAKLTGLVFYCGAGLTGLVLRSTPVNEPGRCSGCQTSTSSKEGLAWTSKWRARMSKWSEEALRAEHPLVSSTVSS